MFSAGRFICISAAITLSAGALCAQNVISAKSGLVHYTEGEVTVAGKTVVDKAGVFPDVKKDELIETSQGRAEVLLTPGVFLRVGEQSSVRMLNTSLADTRVEIVSGRSMVESDTPMKGNVVTVQFQGYATTFVKHGLFEFQASPAQVKVYSGEVQVSAGDQTVTVHEGHSLILTAALAQERFDAKDGDSLYRWSKVRSEYLSIANVSAARYAQGSNYQNSYVGGALGTPFGFANPYGTWAFNDAYGMYTYMPFNGIGYSPFGFPYFSPNTVYQAYAPNYYAPGNYGTVSNNHLNHAPVVTSRAPSTGGVVGRGSSAPALSNTTTSLASGPGSVGAARGAGRGK